MLQAVFIGAIRELNGLKRRRVIGEYALIGAVASTFYLEPVFTEDLDVIVLVESNEEYIQVFRKVGEWAQGMEGMHYILDEIPVQLFPSTTNPLYADVVRRAVAVRIDNFRVKAASPEHLVVLFLDAFRPKDQIRITQLLEIVDNKSVDRLVERFNDDDRTLAPDSKEYVASGFSAKRFWHARNARTSVAKKLKALDRMREAASNFSRDLPEAAL
jgi:predicted nucleotidyltransferase